MADFASDAVLKRRMTLLLDLFWADWAIEQIDGVRGGGKHRIYPGPASTRGHASSGQGIAWLYFGLGTPLTKHPGHMCAVTSAYRPPALVADLALDVAGRGTYEYVSRRPGLNLLPKPPGIFLRGKGCLPPPTPIQYLLIPIPAILLSYLLLAEAQPIGA